MPSFNYTNRKTINSKDINITLQSNNTGTYMAKVNLNLDHYVFPQDSKIFIEAYISNYFMRFDFSENKTYSLDRFGEDDAIKFRIKVTNSEENKIIGMADKLNPKNKKESQLGLLDVKGSSLNGVIWRLDFEEESKPVLLYEKKIGDKDSIATDPILRSLILPTAFKEILTQIFIIEEYSIDDEDDWQAQWIEVCKNISDEEIPALNDSDKTYVYEYINSIVEKFGRKLNLVKDYIKYNEEK